MGGAEDELADNAIKFAKLRPMRVEMYLCVPSKLYSLRLLYKGTH